MADHSDFLLYMSLAEKTAGHWFKHSVYSELGLNIGGGVSAGYMHKDNKFLAGSTMKERNTGFLQDFL